MASRLAVLGAGAVGSVLACLLGGEAYSRGPGWREVRGWGLHCQLPVWGAWEALGLWEAVAVAVKVHQTRGALEWVLAGRAGAPVYLVVQNGFGGLEAWEEALQGRAIVAGGVADFGASRSGWLVELRGPGRLVAGCRGRDCRWALRSLAGAGGPVRVELVADVEPWRWLKAAVNAAVNTVTAAAGAPNRVVLEDEGLYRLAHEVVGEVAGAAEAAGVRLPVDPHRYLDEVAEATGGNLSSTLQDLLACRYPELPWIVARPLKLLGGRAGALRAAYQLARRAFLERCGVELPEEPRETV